MESEVSRKDTMNSACRTVFLYPYLRVTLDPSSEVFVSDQTSNLFAVDVRNGRVIYGYKGSSFTVSPASVADFFRSKASRGLSPP
jgi:hypothetical protein